MDRREALKRVGWLLGGAVSSSVVSGVLAGCRAGGEAAYVPQTLTADQNEMVATLAERIIPATDTPGARDAGVNEFVDKMLTGWFRPYERDHFLDGLADVDRRAQVAHGTSFLEATPEQQIALMEALEDEALAANYEAPPRSANPFPDQSERPFFELMKELTLVGYYTSEVGATQELQAMPFGTFDGDVPLEEIGRAWS